MDDSDEEYLAKAAAYTEKLFSDFDNLHVVNEASSIRQLNSHVSLNEVIPKQKEKKSNINVDRTEGTAKNKVSQKRSKEKTIVSRKNESINGKNSTESSERTTLVPEQHSDEQSQGSSSTLGNVLHIESVYAPRLDESHQKSPIVPVATFKTGLSVSNSESTLAPPNEPAQRIHHSGRPTSVDVRPLDHQKVSNKTKVNRNVENSSTFPIGDVAQKRPTVQTNHPFAIAPRGISTLMAAAICVQRPLMKHNRPALQDQLNLEIEAHSDFPTSTENFNQLRSEKVIHVRHRHITKNGPQPKKKSQNNPVSSQIPDTNKVNARMKGMQINTNKDADSLLEANQKNAITFATPVMPVLGSSANVGDQTTWVEDVPDNRDRVLDDSCPFDPNEPILAGSSSTMEPLSPNFYGYSEMFSELSRDTPEREIDAQPQTSRTVSVMNLNGKVVRLGTPDNNAPDLYPFLTSEPGVSISSPTVMHKQARPMLLPPSSKGKLSESARKSVPVVNQAERVPSRSISNDPRVIGSVEAMPVSIRSQPQRDSTPIPADIEQEDFTSLLDLNSKDLGQMSEERVQEITNMFYQSSPYQKFKANYPFLAEGIVQRDRDTGTLKVYSSRLGKLLIEDTRQRKEEDYVYFIAIKPGVYKGFWFDTHPRCLISAKFPSVELIVLRGYAILAHPVGSREESMKDNQWVCWNDSMGIMPIIKGAAHIPHKKYPVWDKQLDVISIKANYENRRFVVTQVVVLTNQKMKQECFPKEAFLVTDAVYRRERDADLEFYSNTVQASIYIKKRLVGSVDYYENRAFELVVVPTFQGFTAPEFRALLIIHMPCTFWSKDKEWIRELLVKRTHAYRC